MNFNPTTLLYFEYENLDQIVKELKSLGYKFEAEPTDQRWRLREAYLRDPDGNILCLYYAGKNRIYPPQ